MVVTPFVRRAINGVRDCKKVAMAAQFAWKHRDIAANYRFEPMSHRHFAHMMDLSKGFFETEALTQATGSTIDDCRTAMECLVHYSVEAQSVVRGSWVAYENKTGKPIGFRLGHPIYRDPSTAPFSFPESPLIDQEITLFTPLNETFNKSWDIYPDENVIFKGEAVYIDPQFRRSGFFSALMDYHLNLPEIAEKTQANFISVVCTAHATKSWYSKLGFKTIYRSEPVVKNAKGEMVPLKDGEMWLMTNVMRGMTTFDVYPFWRAMRVVKKLQF
ncbi:hypothetical protein PENTCL1PPCAC_12763 [Pristionchus entomophagus]|uniref:N-acetyltransferase domain-containing protein n=1 Tax=Pristionchus entomophagus TaxID=358040 RepID=A0AAV5T5P5_9BILA|nr:hypothetical protein PENTCL1PPCAC_12763 [Pristionchus entomophagus]